MPELSLIEGRLSEYYNHFREYRFENCTVTATRLMGVLALKVTWRGIERQRDRYYQIIHLDYSEYGVDEYIEFECIPGNADYAANKEEMNSVWNNFTGSMGGELIDVTPDAMLRMIEMALPLASCDMDREYDTRENEEFRRYALIRIGLMTEALNDAGITSDTCTASQAITASTPKRLATCETINYFLMRLVDHDYDAAMFLSTLTREQLSDCPLGDPGIQTLIRSRIRRSSADEDVPADGTSVPYRVTITTLARNGYYHSSLVIYLNGDYRVSNPKVTAIEVGSMIRLSDYESAIQVTRPEYITVFNCPDNIFEAFDGRLIPPLAGVRPDPVPNGWLYTIYKKDNSHVNKTEYRIGDDVYGYALMTLQGEFIIMSSEMDNITSLDNSVLFSMYSPYFEVTGKYLLENTPVFHTIVHSPGAKFEDFILSPPKD